MKKLLVIIMVMIDSLTIIVAQDQTDAGIIHSGGIQFRYVREGKGCPMFVIGSSGYSRLFSGNLRPHTDSGILSHLFAGTLPIDFIQEKN